MPGMLVEGEWKTERQWKNTDGRFVRSTTRFRDWVTADGKSGFAAEAGRYHLYIAWACPWAHRTAIMRRLKGLEEVIGLSAVGSFMGEDGWAFYDEPGVILDPVNGAHYLREVYAKAAPDYTGRVTTPVLWDKETGKIVNNESREIVRMLDTEFEGFATTDTNFFSEGLRDDIDAAIDAIFFFQAEDGIRSHCVTGVQTCALPICDLPGRREGRAEQAGRSRQQEPVGEV